MESANVALQTAALGLEIWLLILLFKRHVMRLFPFYVAYTFYSALASLSQLLVMTKYRWYFYVFWTNDSILTILGVFALYEVFRWIFVLFWMKWWFRLIFFGGLLFVISVPILHTVSHRATELHPIVAIIFAVTIAVNFLQAGIFGLFWILAKRLAIDFRRYAFGIMLGFGISSWGALAGFLARFEFGTKLESFLRFAQPVSYILALGFWLHVFSRAEPPEPDQHLAPTEQMMKEARQYLGILRGKRP